VRVRGEVVVDAPLAPTWNALADLASHVEWMADAESITFTSAQRSGVGTTFDCVTKVGPLRTTDRMEVTGWLEGRSIAVRHTGIVIGTGVFDLAAIDNDATRLTWTEDLRFPWFLGGVIATFVARPILKRIWMGNLHRFAGILKQRNL
jgi:carbon monoxide dehydrogenase subunit G